MMQRRKMLRQLPQQCLEHELATPLYLNSRSGKYDVSLKIRPANACLTAAGQHVSSGIILWHLAQVVFPAARELVYCMSTAFCTVGMA